eukprot:CAMPEP_0179068668 /NCGR_PEP_ID=MMETSP0796-20121207/30116_1 /TAXON_ID=73915 /ORGANISM="Pyrodinium bahamense, Strain pbaha01" /LENGTH=74 /DNA_ID=CAMNT_0020765721 /DNA_START=126 /DNA_END=351 /DNA_ORIENTATION=+
MLWTWQVQTEARGKRSAWISPSPPSSPSSGVATAVPGGALLGPAGHAAGRVRVAGALDGPGGLQAWALAAPAPT